MKTYFCVSLFVLLMACGQSTQGSWEGGPTATLEATGKPKGIMILHQGHDCFSGCRYDDGLHEVAVTFANAGFIVYGFEMPPEPHNQGPIERFYQPVIDLLNRLDAEGNTLPIYMAGLSGGGWTTSVVTALDGRITRGYSIEGDPESSDWEQQNPPYDYPTLYAMAGHRLTHIYIPQSTSDCKEWVYQSPCVNDYEATDHYFSSWAVNFILGEIG